MSIYGFWCRECGDFEMFTFSFLHSLSLEEKPASGGSLKQGKMGIAWDSCSVSQKKDRLPSKNRNISYLCVGIKNSIAWQISL